MTQSSLAVVNARVWTGDPRRPWADALLVTGDRIEVVGSSAEVKKRAGAVVPTIDAGGMLVVPGFVDAHAGLESGDPAGATRDLAARGVTSVHHMGEWADVEILREARARGALGARVTAAVPLATWPRLRDEIARAGHGDAWLQLGGVTAPADAMAHEAASAADSAGLQLVLPVGEEGALSGALDLVARIAEERGARDRRPCLVGARHASDADIARVVALGAVVCLHPARAGDEAGVQRLREAGARFVFGSGGPAPRSAPMDTIDAAVAFRGGDAVMGGGARSLRVDDALRACTSDAAWAVFRENEAGMLKPGMLADLVVIDRDITRAAPGTIRDARVMLTLVGGRPVFDAAGLVPVGGSPDVRND